jgi:hypothetical protein
VRRGQKPADQEHHDAMKTRKGLETCKIYIFKVLKQDRQKKNAKKSVETYKIYIL